MHAHRYQLLVCGEKRRESARCASARVCIILSKVQIPRAYDVTPPESGVTSQTQAPWICGTGPIDMSGSTVDAYQQHVAGRSNVSSEAFSGHFDAFAGSWRDPHEAIPRKWSMTAHARVDCQRLPTRSRRETRMANCSLRR